MGRHRQRNNTISRMDIIMVHLRAAKWAEITLSVCVKYRVCVCVCGMPAADNTNKEKKYKFRSKQDWAYNSFVV